MNSKLLERLRGFQLPVAAPLPADHHVVARLTGIDFEGLFRSQDFGFTRPFDARFGKMMVRTASHLLGGDACGRYAFTEHTEFSLLLDRRLLVDRWRDASDVLVFLAAASSSKLSLLVEGETLFAGRLYAFPTADLVVAYFQWRQQQAREFALDTYCGFVLSSDKPLEVRKLLDGLGSEEKEEILRQHQIEFSQLPAWQRFGTGVHLEASLGVVVDTQLPRDSAYGPYLQRYLG